MSFAGFLRESAGSTPFALLWFAVLAMLSGFAIDTSNAWRTEQALSQAASAAAHAGVVALAQGGGTEDVRAAAAAAAAENLPGMTSNRILRSPTEDIHLLRFDADAGEASPSADPDAVLVQLHRSAATGSPVRFLMLHLVAAFVPDARRNWDITAHGAAAITGRTGCAASDGIYSEGQLDITSSQTVGANVCFHGRDGVWMPQRNAFEPGSVVSMPDLDACRNKCVDSANPGASAAAREVNLLPFGIARSIEDLRRDFLTPGGGPAARTFFAERPVSPGPGYADLVAAGVVSGQPEPGAVLRLSLRDFQLLAPLVTGVTYDVSCDPGTPSPLAAYLGEKKAKSNGKRLTVDGTVVDVAVITDCPVHVAKAADVRGALILTTDTKTGVSADSSARLGVEGCVPRERVTLATAAGLRVPAAFTGSNLDVLVDGDVHLAGASAHGRTHRGLNLKASGDVHFSAGHEFRACRTDAPLAPGPFLIREVALAPR